MKKENLGYLQIILANLLSGFLVVLVRWGENLGAYYLVFFRVLLAAILIFLFLLFTGRKIVPFRKEKVKLIFFGVMHGIILISYFFALFFLSVASASLLISTLSIWTVIFSFFILKEKLLSRTIVALIISFIGVIIVLMPQNFFLFESFLGSILGLFAGILAGLVYVLSKTFKHYDKISLTFWQNLIAAPFLIPFLFFTRLNFMVFDFPIVILLGVVGASSFIFMFNGFGKIKGQTGGILALLYIIFSIIFAMIFFKEIPTLNEVIGGIFILLGAYLATR